MNKRLFICLALIILVGLAYAEPADSGAVKAYRLTLKDGSELNGTIVSEDASTVQFRTLSGTEMTVEWEQIVEIASLAGIVKEGRYIRIDPNYTRLLFSPTARPIRSGSGYLSVVELFFASAAVGIGDILSLNVGITLFPGPHQIFQIAPKVTPLHIGDLYLAAGILHMGLTGGDGEGFGILYSVGTYGSPQKALTVGLGWGYAGEETANKPILMIGGELQTSNSFKLITENWFPPGTDEFVYTFGFRFFGEHLAADLGFIGSSATAMDGWPFFPWVGFAYNWGR